MTIEFYAWDTPNGRKISVALEEMALPYHVHPVDIGQEYMMDHIQTLNAASLYDKFTQG